MREMTVKIAYYCKDCPETFPDAKTSNAHHDATGHHQHWLESRGYAANQAPAASPSPRSEP